MARIVMTSSDRVIRYRSVRQYTIVNRTAMYRANMPATAAVERNVVVRMKSGSTADKSHAANIVNHRRLMCQVNLMSQASRNEFAIPDIFQQHGARQHLVFAAYHLFEEPSSTMARLSSRPHYRGMHRNRLELTTNCRQRSSFEGMNAVLRLIRNSSRYKRPGRAFRHWSLLSKRHGSDATVGA